MKLAETIEKIKEIDKAELYIRLTKEKLELITSALLLSREKKRELGERLVSEDHKVNSVKINQLSDDIHNITKMVREYNDLLYGGILE